MESVEKKKEQENPTTRKIYYITPDNLQSEDEESNESQVGIYSGIYLAVSNDYVKRQKKKQKMTKHQCEICEKYFPSKGHLEIHIRTHTGEKPFSCYLCGKKSARLHDLQTHILTHSETKHYGCAYCPSKFNQKSNYTRHLKLHFVPGARKPKRKPKKHFCDFCGEEFSDKRIMMSHMINEHDRKKPFSCEICEKGFTRQYDLKVHLRIHTGEKPYSCKICKINYRQQSNYRRHLKTHLQE